MAVEVEGVQTLLLTKVYHTEIDSLGRFVELASAWSVFRSVAW